MSGKLARLCIHDFMQGHPVHEGVGISFMETVKLVEAGRESEVSNCPGGEFLADDTLVIENTQQLIDELVQRAELATSTEGNHSVHWHFDILRDKKDVT